MKKYVYLFELDSVRNTDREIEIGQKALYDEIVLNGNIVVLTFNQLVDSRGFFSLLDNPDYYNNIIALFESGSICISQFGDIRTISQYLLSSLEYEKEFIYSGWPLKSTQKRLLALIKRSLMYSDLSEINDYCAGKRTAEEIADLFVEVDKNNTVSNTALTTESCHSILNNLYWLLKTVLRLSAVHTIYIPPRSTAEYSNLKLHNILSAIENLSYIQNDERLRAAFNIIKSLPCYGNDNRSNYLHDLQDHIDRHGDNDRLICQYAEAIVNLAYNYACEISICNISKHYDIDELNPNSGGQISFESDFKNRLTQYMEIGDYDSRFLLKETNSYVDFSPNKKFPDFTKAVRLNNYLSNSRDCQFDSVWRYENKLKQQRKKHKLAIIGAIGKRFLLAAICFCIAFGVEVLFQVIQGALDEFVNLSYLWWIAIETFTFICASEIISSGISRFLKKCFDIEFLSFAEALAEIGKLIYDAFYIIRKNAQTYFNPSLHNRNNVERFSEGVLINFVRSASMKKYIQLRASADSSLFSESEAYPIAQSGDISVTKNLARLEELFNYQFGVVYKSKYNTVIVDPIINQNTFYPYERIIPTSSSGVVMVTKHGDKFVLLKQYRHAPRKLQYSFPRGCNEDGLLSADNAKKELYEELKATISAEPKLLGRISPDSGLTSSCVFVYFVEIDSYEITKEEGILDVIELTDSELEEKIRANKNNDRNDFDDGFTLAAYMLYKSRRKNGEETE